MNVETERIKKNSDLNALFVILILSLSLAATCIFTSDCKDQIIKNQNRQTEIILKEIRK